MKLLALIASLDHVCYRYRIEAFAWALAERGWMLQPAPLPRQTWGRVRQLASARLADAVILQRKLLPLWQLAILRRSAKCLIYDVDDAVFCRDSYHGKPPESWQRTARFWATVYAADATIAGNDYLRRRAASYVEADRVHVIPTCVEPSRYPPARHHRVGPAVRLAWIGQQATLPSLHRAQPHLAAVGRGLPGLELRVICDRFPRLSGVKVAPRPCSSASEAAQLAECDVGVSWLPDDPWSRGKCGLKVLQYMAAGLPVVANPVGMNRQMVLHGRTGLLATTPEEWAAAIGKLAADPELRQTMGDAGRRLVRRHYRVAQWGPTLAVVVAQAAARVRAGSRIHSQDLPVDGATPISRGPVQRGPAPLSRPRPRQAALGRQQ
jgi:glycosyltransferase involved in cell wall biosynthesis